MEIYGATGKRLAFYTYTLGLYVDIYITTTQNLVKHDVSLVKKYGKVFSYFEASRPTLWIADAQLIRTILVKDFENFIDRRVYVSHEPSIYIYMTILMAQTFL